MGTWTINLVSHDEVIETYGPFHSLKAAIAAAEKESRIYCCFAELRDDDNAIVRVYRRGHETSLRKYLVD